MPTKSLLFACVLALGAAIHADGIEIVGYQTDRGLQFQGGTVSNFYTLEFAPTLDGPWTNWGSVSTASITGSVMSLPAPFFYRIVEVPPDAGFTYATGTPIYVETDSLALSQGFATSGSVDSALSGYVSQAATSEWVVTSHSNLASKTADGSFVLSSQPMFARIYSITNLNGDLSAGFTDRYDFVASISSNAFRCESLGAGMEFFVYDETNYWLCGPGDDTNHYLFKKLGEDWTDVSNDSVWVNIAYSNDFSRAGYFGDGSLLGGILTPAQVATQYLPYVGATMDLSMGRTFSVRSGYGYFSDRIGIGTNSARVTIPNNATSPVGLHMVDNWILLEKTSNRVYSSTPAFIALGYDMRHYGRAVLWLNSAKYMAFGTQYDECADIYMGRGGTNMDDGNISWILSSRYAIDSPIRHDGNGQFAILEAEGAGDSALIGGKRFGIYPDQGGTAGAIIMGNETGRFSRIGPSTNSTVTIRDNTVRGAQLYIESETNNAATAQTAGWLLRSGTNSYGVALVGSNGSVRTTLNGILQSPAPAEGDLRSIVVTADTAVPTNVYAIGADTTSNDVAMTLPDMGTAFASRLIRKFSETNALTLRYGTNVVRTLYADGETCQCDWWPERSNWFVRVP